MEVGFGGQDETWAGVDIELSGTEVAAGTGAFLVAHGIHVSGPRTVTVNGEPCKVGRSMSILAVRRSQTGYAGRAVARRHPRNNSPYQPRFREQENNSVLYDIHHDLGAKRRLPTYESAVEAVRAQWPGARIEGSTGSQRSFWTGTSSEAELVGHAWEVRSRKGGWWVRVRTE